LDKLFHRDGKLLKPTNLSGTLFPPCFLFFSHFDSSCWTVYSKRSSAICCK
jgi:hypothetical protein